MWHLAAVVVCLLALVIGTEIRFRRSTSNGRGQQYKDLMSYTHSYDARHQKRLERMAKIKSDIDEFSKMDYNAVKGATR